MKKLVKKIIRRVTLVSRPAIDAYTKEKFYPFRWEVLGLTIYTGYISAKKYEDEQSEYLGIV